MVYATSLRWFSSQKDRIRISAINFTFIFFSWAILHLNFLSLKLTATRDKPFHLLAMEQNLEHDNSMQKNFNERVAIVHREKSNKCNFCDYASSHAGHLRTHLKMHSGEKTKKCSLCDYASSYASNLKIHLKMHSVDTYLIFFRNARNAVSVNFLVECTKIPEKTRKLLFGANMS